MSIGMLSEQDFAARMVARYRELLLRCAGLQSINIDGQTVAYADINTQYRLWSSKLARYTNARPRVLSFDLQNAQ